MSRLWSVRCSGTGKILRTLTQYTFEIRHLLDMGPGQFLVISHDGSNLVAETIKSGGVADEEEA